MSRVALFTFAGDIGGQRQYESALLEALQHVAAPPDVTRVRTRNVRSELPGELRLPSGKLAVLPGPLQRAVTGVVLRKYDLIHRCDLRLPVAPREVITIHDTAWMHDDDAPAPPRASLESVHRARAVIAPSRFSAEEIAQNLGRTDVIVALNGVDEDVAATGPLAVPRLVELGLDRPFLFCAGGNAKRKNMPALLAAWTKLGLATHLLAVSGMGSRSVKVPGVVPLGHLPRSEYLGVLAAADAVVVPSLYEGFGLPALEGMAAGKPVLASNRASLPEVCGDGALLLPPDPTSLAEGIRGVLLDENLRAGLRARGPIQASRFTWMRSAEIHARVYREALGL